MYMTILEIRTLSRRIPAIIDATDEEIQFWMDDAFDTLNNYCQQDFVYEKQTTKSARATTNTLVYLPKVLSGDVIVGDIYGNVIYNTSGGGSSSAVSPVYIGSGSGSSPFGPDSFSTYNDNPSYTTGGMSGGGSGATNGQPVEIFPGNFVIGYYRGNTKQPSRNAEILSVTGDWGYAPTVEILLFDGINKLRDLYEAHRVNTVVHSAPDLLNPILSPVATDLETAAILLNELKGVVNSHFGDFVVHQVADPNVAIMVDVTDLQSAMCLLWELKLKFNAHTQNGGSTTSVHANYDVANYATFSTDFDGAVMPRAIRRVFLRLVQRIALRDEAEDHRQINSPYVNETLGDGYTYDLSNGTLRNLIRPEEAHMLLPYVNRGRVVI